MLFFLCAYWAAEWFDTAATEHFRYDAVYWLNWLVRLVFQFMALAGIPIAITRGAMAFIPSTAWRLRLGFMTSAALTLALYMWVGHRWAWGTAATWLGAGFGAAFFGALAATWLETPLWEDNSPPSKAIQEEVLQFHLEVLGEELQAVPWKRAFDLGLGFLGAVLSMPAWVLIAFLVWFEDPGPLLFVKNSVGKGGKNFRQFKFRTMVRGAESHTGPILASLEDRRVLYSGKLLRKTALDELPQLLNILRGEMSFVGPRPQRTILVYGYLQTMPEYAERHRLLPGLSGLAQVAGDYYLSPRQKLRFDRLYIQHISLGFDLKLILLAFLITFWYRWQKNWNGRLPRRVIRFGS